ncbi:hypothetical protein DKX38_013830 [Salix brachista]|uniref:CCHC-type domain-containing protein n=1 Tax=Salix brachista TaxID=2182728 RepID=A0A5N5LFQ5_9ROSI|nr:hypothetical protein DKX38_013830 [Salix brachista]
MRSITSWCAVCIPGRKQKETKTAEPEKSSRKKSSRKRSSGSDDQAEGSSHQGSIHASSADTGGAAVVVMTSTQMSDMEGSSHGGGGGDGGGILLFECLHRNAKPAGNLAGVESVSTKEVEVKLVVIIGRHVHARGDETQSLHYLFDILNIGGSSNDDKRSEEPSSMITQPTRHDHDYDSVVVNMTSHHDQVTLQEVQYMLQSQEMRLEQLNLPISSDNSIPNANLATQLCKSLTLQGFNDNFSNSFGRNFASRRGHERERWSKGNRPLCQLCNRPGHVALKCYHRFDISYQGQHNFTNVQHSNDSSLASNNPTKIVNKLTMQHQMTPTQIMPGT